MKGIDFKELSKKVNTKKVLGLASIAVAVASTLINNKTQANERIAMKEEIKNELLEYLRSDS